MLNFKILEILLKNPDISQRELSKQVHLSIGKVNASLNRLQIDGYIEINKSGNRYDYHVSDKGRNFLLQELEILQESKVPLQTIKNKKVTQAVILAAGERKEFNQPVCLLDIEGSNLLKRTVTILEENGIEKIIIVTGYQKDAIENDEYLKGKDPIFFVENPRYLWTGSMASLAVAAEHVTDDFVLIEDDILLEERVMRELLQHEDRDCMLLTKESGSGDEAYVEIRNGTIYEISKDIYRLNRIDGEMVGMTKISYEVFNEMLEIFKSNKNPYINYEYTLLDVSRTIDLSYLKIPDMIWYEIDNQENYHTVVDKIFPLLKVKEEAYKEHQLKQTIANALKIKVNQVTAISPLGGLTNRNYKVTINEKDYAVRFPGKGTESYLNRQAEKIHSFIVSNLGVHPKIVYFDEQTGLKLAEYIPNAETLNSKTGKRQDNLSLVARIFQKVHHSGEKFVDRFDVFEKITEYETILHEFNGKLPDDYDDVKRQVLELKSEYQSLPFELAPCHIDPLAENFVKSGEDQMFLIDWEYAGMNDPLWDIAAYSIEAELSSSEEKLFLLNYFNGEMTDEEAKRLWMNKIFLDFLWTIWALMKEALGEDFGSYAATRYHRANSNLREYDKLQKVRGKREGQIL
ncbi:winged helix-turn-helix transcriptional regulator [Neobacillus dielmonensis]|uniref:winged helix-turn-helix transcriptional regulator n=1 Tax=Neobacillus dielmonensis TaxID=1347369 RepID=UPI0005A7B575|nr:winged helix-turn-helix transcriptional regulator [Neobacillus dielmonensis]